MDGENRSKIGKVGKWQRKDSNRRANKKNVEKGKKGQSLWRDEKVMKDGLFSPGKHIIATERITLFCRGFFPPLEYSTCST